MSLSTIELLNIDKKNQVELNPSSELFTIDSGFTFRGTFDESHIEDKDDKGNVSQKKLSPRIMVDSRPNGLTERTSIITRENGTDSFTFKFIGKDEEGIAVLWLV